MFPQCNTWIIQDGKLKIVDSPTMLIFRMGQGAYCYCFCPNWCTLHHLWMFATTRQLHYPRCKTTNRWPFIEAAFHVGAESMTQLSLPIKTTTTLFMDVCNQSPVRLPRCNTRTCWRSTDAHFQDEVGSMSLLFLPQKAANTSCMDVFNQSLLRLPNMASHKSLMLQWHPFSEWDSNRVAISCSYEDSQYVGYV